MTKVENELAESAKPLEKKAASEDVSSGTLLKAARENAGFSIERAAIATRIARPFIEALEADQFEKLLGAVFGRGFIRNLCKAYGADSAAILVAFDHRTNLGLGKDAGPTSRDEKRHQQLKKGVLLIQPNEWRKRFKTLAPHHYLRVKPLVLIVGAVVLLGIIVNQFDFDNNSNQQDSNAPAVAANVGEVTSVPTPVLKTPEPSPSLVQVAPPAGVNVAIPAEQPLVASQATENGFDSANPPDLELRVKEPVNVKISKDDEKSMTGQLKPDTYRYRFKNGLKIFVEDISVVDVYFRGQKVPTSTVKGESKRLTFSASDPQIAKKPSAPQF